MEISEERPLSFLFHLWGILHQSSEVPKPIKLDDLAFITVDKDLTSRFNGREGVTFIPLSNMGVEVRLSDNVVAFLEVGETSQPRYFSPGFTSLAKVLPKKFHQLKDGLHADSIHWTKTTINKFGQDAAAYLAPSICENYNQWKDCFMFLWTEITGAVEFFHGRSRWIITEILHRLHLA